MVSGGLHPAHLMVSCFHLVEDCHQAQQFLTLNNHERMCIFLQVGPQFLPVTHDVAQGNSEDCAQHTS